MNNKLKLIATLSLAAVVTTGCSTAPAPWAKDKGNAAGNGVKHTHKGVAHTHPLPSAGIHHSHTKGGNGGSTNNNGSNAGGTTHQHGATTHSHPLPAQGINHNHGGGPTGTTAGGGGRNNNGDSYTETYGGYGDTTGGRRDDGGFYDTDYPRRDSGRDSGSRYGSGSGSGSGSDRRDYGRDSDKDYDSSSSRRDRDSAYDSYDGSYDSSRSSSSSSSSSNRNSDTYTVQKGDTVFAVMRATGAYWKDIIRLNDLQAPKYEIQPGQRLVLPKERDDY